MYSNATIDCKSHYGDSAYVVFVAAPDYGCDIDFCEPTRAAGRCHSPSGDVARNNSKQAAQRDCGAWDCRWG